VDRAAQTAPLYVWSALKNAQAVLTERCVSNAANVWTAPDRTASA